MNSGWQTRKLGDVCVIANGGTPKTNIADYWGGSHSWITPAEMGKRISPYVDDTERRLTSRGLNDSSARLLPIHSVILSSRAPIGHLVINTCPMATNQGCKGLVPTDSIHYKYLFYYLLSKVDLLNELGTGATFKELSGVKLKEIPIPLPPLLEQQRIAVILDEVFAEIAKAIGHAQKNLQNVRDLFESHLNTIFTTKGDGWVEKKLGGICQNLDSKRVPITKKNRSKGQYPYYGASGIVDYVGEFIFDDDLLLVSEDGANLLARTYPIAFSVSGKVWVNNHAHVLKFDKIETQRFIEYYLNSIKLDNYVSGMAQPKLNQKSLNSITVPVPALPEQQRIVILLDTLTAETKRLEAIYQKKLDNLTALKQSILQKAFAGELTTKTSAQILTFPQKIPNLSVAELQAGIIAIAYQHHKKSGEHSLKFGRVKAEKLVHLAEAWCGIDLERNPMQMAAGPADMAAYKAAEAWAKENGGFSFKKEGERYTFHKGKNFDGLVSKTQDALGSTLNEKLNTLIRSTLHMVKVEIEVLATLYAAWNNRLINNQAISDDDIILDARDNWHPDKLAIKCKEFVHMLKWMKQNSFMPEGKGTLVNKGSLL